MSRKTIVHPAILAIFSGILLAVSYPQLNLSIFAWVALIPLLFAIEGLPCRQAGKNLFQSFGLGWLTGFVMFVGQIFWLKIFHVSIPLVLSAYLALYFGLFCLMYRFVKDKVAISDFILIPIIWVSIEYIRSIGPWGFPAGLLGYSQYQNILFIQIADIIGIFGISFLVALINASLFSIIKNYSLNRAVRISSLVILIFVVVFLYGGIKISNAETEKNIKVALIQSNFNYDAKEKYNVNEALKTLDKLTSQAVEENPALIIWPETVIKESVRLDLNTSKKINGMVNKYKSYLLFGNPDIKKVNGKVKRYNSAFLVSPQGEVIRQYNKIHPVPFWEVIPIRRYLPFLRNTEAKGTCERGNEFTVFNVPEGKFSTLICFEGIFSDLTRKFVKNGARFLVNITNDSWSRSKTEHYQHASMNVFRAIENRIYYVRVGNSGVTEIIDPYGRVNKSIPVYQRDCIVADIGLRKENTFYSKFGDYFGYLSLLLTGGMFGIALISKERDKDEA